MLNSFEIALYGFVAMLLPLAIFSLVSGAQPPEYTPLAKYYRAEKYLQPCGNLFLITVCANSIARLAQHFGYIHAGLSEQLAPYINVPFLVLLVAFLALWIKAYVKVRRAGNGASTA